ncbi:hypothetical protein OG413_15655 [Streptomyces sp. NBC_01433]|uniref:hypothetical protein n=1 Tax=Streptomyces sp. NBC_01433 TaxID=2903864 RepID=UPI002259F2A2|nr:hypothetical protein [Streptomyces sp. NBC_01433]MCX4676720.1 hypothetical protein [Streptomyces sp. NBC_01433]
MPTHPLITWAVDHPWPTASITAASVAILGGTLWGIARMVRSWTWPPLPVLVAGAGALVCTAYSGDTSWRFAGERLGMADSTERALMFGAGELALLACAVMARANKAATATKAAAGSAGVPGVLVWVITGVQVIPCYATSGIVGGTVRAVIGPVLAGLLWHLAMGLEIRVARPDSLSTGLPAIIGRELRERLLSYLGLATRDRTAEQITRDRATARAVRLAAVLELRPSGWLSGYRRRSLAAAVARSGAGTNGEQRHRLLQLLAARRTSGQLATVPLASPWAGTPVPEMPYPRTPLGVTGAQLRTMDPLAVVHLVRDAHPEDTPAEVAALCTEYGVPVSETQVRVALRAGNSVAPALTRLVPDPPEVVPADVRLLPVTCHQAAPRPTPVLAAAGTRTRTVVHAEVPVPEDPDEDVPEGDRDVPDPDPLIEQVRVDHGTQVPGIKPLRRQYGIGQARAQRIRDALGGTA